ncbi:hypothetical protein FEDK69T_00900 [Flavobacterium enshiense DK69]|uniref:Lipoprotein n=1 Tax=Flavobacterium enshiense DK69 TaxID=1107311 RepID=V6SEJ5_9FLAO|nr:DUF6146 family protein [Flavobacterium enshiense]ESU25123.1 hypothetical protein FEDK69T_00900 [Flavobacterium enshiense DK69]KGO96980.1 hypothetical protein Q767_04605 [Flavobacterium enshiense DK69]
MKTLIYILVVTLVTIMFGCNSTSKPVAENNPNAKTVAENKSNNTTSDSLWIKNPEIKYEILIIDGGFNPWLQSTAKPRGVYTQKQLESRNAPWIIEWNNRVRSPKTKLDSQLFNLHIDYDTGTDYGYEVNYLLYNYLVYFQLKNNIRLGGFTPRP